MGRLESQDIRTGAQYEAVRDDARRKNSSLRERRRVQLSERVSLVFENRETVRSIVEETLRSERISDTETVAREVETFKPFVPGERELMATLFLEANDPVELANLAADMAGLPRHVSLDVAGRRLEAQAVANSDAASDPAFCLKFTLDEPAKSAFGSGPVLIVADHPACRGSVELGDDLRQALLSEI